MLFHAGTGNADNLVKSAVSLSSDKISSVHTQHITGPPTRHLQLSNMKTPLAFITQPLLVLASGPYSINTVTQTVAGSGPRSYTITAQTDQESPITPQECTYFLFSIFLIFFRDEAFSFVVDESSLPTFYTPTLDDTLSLGVARKLSRAEAHRHSISFNSASNCRQEDAEQLYTEFTDSIKQMETSADRVHKKMDIVPRKQAPVMGPGKEFWGVGGGVSFHDSICSIRPLRPS
jgi:hypothetical protein